MSSFFSPYRHQFIRVGACVPHVAVAEPAHNAEAVEALLATGSLHYFSVLAGAILGAVLGDQVSYWIGRWFGPAIAGVWPFTRNPDL